MFSQSPHLRCHRPSATTVEFTVSTARRKDNLAVRSLHVAFALARVVLGLAMLLLGYAKWNSKLGEQGISLTGQVILKSWIGQMALKIVMHTRTWILFSVISAVAYGIFRRGYTGQHIADESIEYLTIS